MQFSRLLQLGCLVSTIVAVPLDESIDAAKIPEYLQTCVQAENCEVFIDEAGAYSLRFVKDKGVDSAWYDKTFQNFNHSAPPEEIETNSSSQLVARDGSCNSDVCTVSALVKSQ
jgi:hypothetical protein